MRTPSVCASSARAGLGHGAQGCATHNLSERASLSRVASRAMRGPPLLADPIFCTVAGSCRIVAGQLPDSCRLFFTQLPSFWSEKSKFCKINPFSNQNGGNCVKNRRQLSGNWPATIRQLPATVQKIGSTKRGGPPFAWLAAPSSTTLDCCNCWYHCFYGEGV